MSGTPMSVSRVESDEERDERFKPLNDRVWGEGNWVRCGCALDDYDRQTYHSKAMHPERVMSAPFAINDVVSIAWMPKSRFRIVCVEDNQVWAQDLSDGGRLTLNIDTIERVKP